jgi:hypothetical protein
VECPSAVDYFQGSLNGILRGIDRPCLPASRVQVGWVAGRSVQDEFVSYIIFTLISAAKCRGAVASGLIAFLLIGLAPNFLQPAFKTSFSEDKPVRGYLQSR